MDWKSGTGSKEKKKKKEFTIAKWTNNTTLFTPCGKGDGEKDVQNIFNEELYTPDCFDLLVSEDVIKYITDISNSCALQRNHTLNVTPEEIRVYIAILLLTGYLSPKYMRM